MSFSSSSSSVLPLFFFCLLSSYFTVVWSSLSLSPRSIYICNSGDPSFLGEYLPVLQDNTETENNIITNTDTTVEEKEQTTAKAAGITGTGERGSFIYTNEEGRSIW